MRGVHTATTFSFELTEPAELPDGERPLFRMIVPRYGTTVRLRELFAELDGIESPILESPADDAAIARYNAAHAAAERIANELTEEMLGIVNKHVVGWERVYGVDGEPMPYAPNSVGEAVDVVGIYALSSVLRNGSALSAAEKKLSASPSASPMAAIAEGAPEGASSVAEAAGSSRSVVPNATGDRETVTACAACATGSAKSPSADAC